MINVILAEDHVLVRKAIKTLLEAEADITVTGEADNGEQVVELIKNKVQADIILAEINMPGMDAMEMLGLLKEMAPNSKIAFLSMMDNEKSILQAIQAGAKGYLNKTIDVFELLFAVRHIYNNGQYICTSSSMALLNKMQQMPQITPVEISPDTEFSVREIEILTLMAEGYTNYEIAEKLFTSKRTVENYRQNMLNKTGSRNTAALIKFAINHGIVK
ncbi:response regulator transcription factor [Mucilaginibacter sp. PAMB04274]|uniref:response regulator transcription factor n=1 Tax=Mucilaginibacter sp. PAMB04274 TaxID=3138568 RepID=UPI0031F68AA8